MLPQLGWEEQLNCMQFLYFHFKVSIHTIWYNTKKVILAPLPENTGKIESNYARANNQTTLRGCFIFDWILSLFCSDSTNRLGLFQKKLWNNLSEKWFLKHTLPTSSYFQLLIFPYFLQVKITSSLLCFAFTLILSEDELGCLGREKLIWGQWINRF